MLITRIEGRQVPSQHPDLYKGPNFSLYLSWLVRVWTAVEEYTGHAWKATSFIRDSVNHSTGCALDIAPDIDPASAPYYAVTHHSDPVLYKRIPLMRALQKLCADVDPGRYSVGLFVEPDHIHIQLFIPEGEPVIQVYKWKGPKEVYADTRGRMDLPPTDTWYTCEPYAPPL